MEKTKTQPNYQVVGRVLEALIENKAHKATAYLSDKFVINMTCKLYNGKLLLNKNHDEIILTLGRPNYEQREFIKQCKKVGESFPVKKIQLRFPPKRK